MGKSVFVKLLLGFLLVAAPMYGICLGVTWYGSKNVLESASQSIQQELYFFTNYYEEDAWPGPAWAARRHPSRRRT